MAVDLDPLRQLVTDRNFDLHGVAATITQPFGVPVASRVIWLRSLMEDTPAGHDYSRRGPRRAIAIRRSGTGFSEVPRGTVVSAPEKLGAAATNWQVDGIEEMTRSHFVVTVVPETGV